MVKLFAGSSQPLTPRRPARLAPIPQAQRSRTLARAEEEVEMEAWMQEVNASLVLPPPLVTLTEVRLPSACSALRALVQHRKAHEPTRTHGRLRHTPICTGFFSSAARSLSRMHRPSLDRMRTLTRAVKHGATAASSGAGSSPQRAIASFFPWQARAGAAGSTAFRRIPLARRWRLLPQGWRDALTATARVTPSARSLAGRPDKVLAVTNRRFGLSRRRRDPVPRWNLAAKACPTTASVRLPCTGTRAHVMLSKCPPPRRGIHKPRRLLACAQAMPASQSLRPPLSRSRTSSLAACRAPRPRRPSRRRCRGRGARA